jgi:hypothetical protein
MRASQISEPWSSSQLANGTLQSHVNSGHDDDDDDGDDDD